MERRDEAAIAFFGSWMVTGLYLDGWSHIHQRPETFFTPWHAVLYSGFAVACVYFIGRGIVSGRRLELDRVTNAGFVLFLVAAFGDFGWHMLFGIERSLAALLSPTHLALMTGGLMMLSGPIRDAHGRTIERFSDFFPTLVCCTLITTVVMFFLQYLNAFTLVGMFGTRDEAFKVYVVSAVLVTNAVLMGVAFFMRRNWRIPPGAFTFMFAVVALSGAGLESFRARHIITAIVGGATADYLADRSDGAFGVGVPLVTWSTWVAVTAVFGTAAWSPNIWLGAIFLATLSGLGLSVLVARPVTTTTATPPAEVRDRP
jgi:hypothetical protein